MEREALTRLKEVAAVAANMEEFSDADLEGEQVNDTDFTPEKALDLMPKTTTRWSLSTAPVRVTRYESEKETSD